MKNQDMLDKSKNIIFFDGVCNLCNASVNFIIKRDGNARFLFCPLQSTVAKTFLHENGYSKVDSLLLIKKSTIYEKSTAVLKIARDLNGLWPLLSILLILPVSIRDFIYNKIARNRYRWFGKQSSCRVPSKKEKDLFIS
jgi:predicted DCC family thiol-disulfide oxidoreductase YuxK